MARKKKQAVVTAVTAYTGGDVCLKCWHPKPGSKVTHEDAHTAGLVAGADPKPVVCKDGCDYGGK